MAASPPSSDWQGLAETLADGFQAMLKELEILSRKEQDLNHRLQYAFQEYVKLASDPVLDDRDPHDHEAVARRILKQDTSSRSASPDSLSLNLPKALENKGDVKRAFEAYKAVKSRRQGDLNPLRCPLSDAVETSTVLERDFTTPGVKGNLGCPFARLAQTNGVPTPPQEIDPIAAEFHPVSHSSVEPTPSTAGAAVGKCPIRFLDQHSPEEVAKYFENHKHEIPRSHEICVKRYQRNTTSIRELDSKYGNLVNMIQGLGVKHQQFLTAKDGEQSVGAGPSSAELVEKWADQVSHRSAGLGPSVGSPVLEQEQDDGADADDERTGHFQRPLREVRLGESPSRPWGISVPFTAEKSPSVAPAPVMHTVAMQPTAARIEPSIEDRPQFSKAAGGKCPFDHEKLKRPKDEENKTGTKAPPTNATQLSQPTLVFHGPVFFGYSAEQAATMMNSMSHDILKSVQ